VLERDPANSRPAQGLIPLAALATALLPARLTGKAGQRVYKFDVKKPESDLF
jgi:hypothetical protein